MGCIHSSLGNSVETVILKMAGETDTKQHLRFQHVFLHVAKCPLGVSYEKLLKATTVFFLYRGYTFFMHFCYFLQNELL